MFAVTDGIEVNWAGIGVAVVLLALNGFFVAAEFALLAARRSRIEQLAADGDRRARHALAGLRELTLMLAGAQLGITMCSLGLGAVAEPAVAGVIEGVLGEAFESVRHGATRHRLHDRLVDRGVPAHGGGRDGSEVVGDLPSRAFRTVAGPPVPAVRAVCSGR
jgi:hypothetical protein